MIKPFLQWLTRKWTMEVPSAELLQDYRATFATPHGQRVLQHWLDSIYCTTFEGTDEHMLWQHNAKRDFVHDILVNLDMAETPDKYRVRTEV